MKNSLHPLKMCIMLIWSYAFLFSLFNYDYILRILNLGLYLYFDQIWMPFTTGVWPNLGYNVLTELIMSKCNVLCVVTKWKIIERLEMKNNNHSEVVLRWLTLQREDYYTQLHICTTGNVCISLKVKKVYYTLCTLTNITSLG